MRVDSDSTEDRQDIKEAQENAPCRFCGEAKDFTYDGICHECVEGILLKLLPKLKRVLEDKHGEMLDRWLALGNFRDVYWEVREDFQVKASKVKRLLKEVLDEAIEKEKILLSLANDESWKPFDTEELREHIYKSCIENLQQQIRESIVKALSTAPTLVTQREIIEMASGKRRSSKRYVRDEAISIVAFCEANCLPWPLGDLIIMRYQRDKGKSPYTEVNEGIIDEVWLNVEGLLPEEIARLIERDETL
jgi:hypothetical protein